MYLETVLLPEFYAAERRRVMPWMPWADAHPAEFFLLAFAALVLAVALLTAILERMGR